jgi:hypothetical protein
MVEGAADLKTKAVELRQQIQDQAQDALRASAQVASDKLREATDGAKDVASHAAGKLQESAARQQASGANYLARFADHVREASHTFAIDTPLAQRGMATAADFIDDAAIKLRDGNAGDVITMATDFARRKPVAFLGISALAGFAVMRFLKASETAAESEPDEA